MLLILFQNDVSILVEISFFYSRILRIFFFYIFTHSTLQTSLCEKCNVVQRIKREIKANKIVRSGFNLSLTEFVSSLTDRLQTLFRR